MTSDDRSPTSPDRAITLKSILFGLLGIFIICGLAGFHDDRIASTPPMIGTHLPVAAYTFIFLVAFGWNMLWSRFLPRLVLSPNELLVVMAISLVACYPPTSGLFRYFQRIVVLPWYYLSAGGKTDWEKFGLLEYISPKLFPQPAPAVIDGSLRVDDTVYRGFFTGLAQGSRAVGLAEIPWAAWVVPLLHWTPLVIVMSVCLMALSLLVHQQWAHHEQLSYPLAQVAHCFVRREHGKGIPDLFRSRLFWWGFSPLIAIYTLHYLHAWFPEYLPGFGELMPDVKSWSVDIFRKLPILTKAPSRWYLSSATTYFSVIGLAYFVSSEISLTLGLSTTLWVVAGAWFYVVTGTTLRGDELGMVRGGAYFGYAMILLYTGRHYYLTVTKRAFGFGRSKPHEQASVFAARVLLIFFVAFVVLLTSIGLDWLIAFFFALFLLLAFLVFTRIICETGIPFLQTGWTAGALLTSLFGPTALGPGPLVYVLWLGNIFMVDPRECLMPYVATGLKMADDAALNTRRIFGVLIVALVIALAVGFVSSTWTQYNFGGIATDGYAGKYPPTTCFDTAAFHIAEMNDGGTLERSASTEGLGKLALFAPDPSKIGFILFGIAAVLLFSSLRLRFTGFPLHPVLFLVAGTFAAGKCWWSFLVGWAIKCMVVRFGGGKVYQQLKPLFVGIIAGELLAAGASIIFEIIYYCVTGEPPGRSFGILVG